MTPKKNETTDQALPVHCGGWKPNGHAQTPGLVHVPPFWQTPGSPPKHTATEITNRTQAFSSVDYQSKKWAIFSPEPKYVAILVHATDHHGSIHHYAINTIK